jgi:hypothetical protein
MEAGDYALALIILGVLAVYFFGDYLPSRRMSK